MLWPGYYNNKRDAMPEPIIDEIPILKVSVDGPLDSQYTANGTAETLDYPANGTAFRFFPQDEMHYVLRGKAEVVYSLASNSHQKQQTITLNVGDFYVIPVGARMTWKIGDEALRILRIILPGIPKTMK